MFGAGEGDCLAAWFVELLEVPRDSYSGGICQKKLSGLGKSLWNRRVSEQVRMLLTTDLGSVLNNRPGC